MFIQCERQRNSGSTWSETSPLEQRNYLYKERGMDNGQLYN